MMRIDEDEADLFLDVLGDILVENRVRKYHFFPILVAFRYLFNVELVHRLRRCVR
jgi:hypothetical protein